MIEKIDNSVRAVSLAEAMKNEGVQYMLNVGDCPIAFDGELSFTINDQGNGLAIHLDVFPSSGSIGATKGVFISNSNFTNAESIGRLAVNFLRSKDWSMVSLWDKDGPLPCLESVK